MNRFGHSGRQYSEGRKDGGGVALDGDLESDRIDSPKRSGARRRVQRGAWMSIRTAIAPGAS